MRRFAGIDWIGERIPDETTIQAFRHLLEKHELGRRIFDTVKAHLKAKGMAMESGLIHSVETTAANVHDLTPAAELLHGEESVDAGYQGTKAHFRAKGEHPIGVIKQQFGFQKTRLRGMTKNRCKVHVLAALTNLYLARRHLQTCTPA